MTSPAAAIAAAYHGVRAAKSLDLMPSGRNPIVYGLLQTAHDYPTSVSRHRKLSSSRMHAAIMLPDFALPNPR